MRDLWDPGCAVTLASGVTDTENWRWHSRLSGESGLGHLCFPPRWKPLKPLISPFSQPPTEALFPTPRPPRAYSFGTQESPLSLLQPHCLGCSESRGSRPGWGGIPVVFVTMQIPRPGPVLPGLGPGIELPTET